MGIIDNIKSGLSRVIWKGVKHAGTAAAGIATAVLLKKLHYDLSPDHQALVALTVSGSLGACLKKLKDMFPKQLGWL